MKLDATKIILALIAVIGSLATYIARDVQVRVGQIESRIETMTQAGAFDLVADYIADKDSLTEADMRFIEYIMENSK